MHTTMHTTMRCVGGVGDCLLSFPSHGRRVPGRARPGGGVLRIVVACAGIARGSAQIGSPPVLRRRACSLGPGGGAGPPRGRRCGVPSHPQSGRGVRGDRRTKTCGGAPASIRYTSAAGTGRTARLQNAPGRCAPVVPVGACGTGGDAGHVLEHVASVLVHHCAGRTLGGGGCTESSSPWRPLPKRHPRGGGAGGGNRRTGASPERSTDTCAVADGGRQPAPSCAGCAPDAPPSLLTRRVSGRDDSLNAGPQCRPAVRLFFFR